jgi:hypothetical protein
VDETGLARFVTPQASRWLALPVSRFDLADRPEQRRILAETPYEALTQRNIRYALEEYHPAQALQKIRTPEHRPRRVGRRYRAGPRRRRRAAPRGAADRRGASTRRGRRKSRGCG